MSQKISLDYNSLKIKKENLLPTSPTTNEVTQLNQISSASEFKEKSTSIDKSNKMNLNNNNDQSNVLNLILGWNLRNELISMIVKLSGLMKSRCTEFEKKKELVEEIQELMQQLSDLLPADTGDALENLASNNESYLKVLSESEYGLYFIISTDARLALTYLLMKNSITLFKSPVPDKDKDDIFKENKKQIYFLVDLENLCCNLDFVKDKKEGKFIIQFFNKF